ncbi:hypothetical protein NIES593_01210 [Hydrococcus rivularis NIES-593]|uniref:Uncharacterized protein n=1 Tax=Hydrococcus rivularis NIES-593 TaxID=1921803 RepID=A0A1U7HSZ6_9CYAN|nr:hypothetical protein [Hydrococcus rivularis]OKH26697.1 hypothetical protein NIES593_01210 [Hydrococcus rivularis NIES-593]
MFKKLLIIFLLAIVGGFAAGFYYWRQFAAVPYWYKNQSTNIKNERLEITNQIQRSSDSGNNLTLQLNREDLNQLLAKKISENSQSSQLLQSAKSIKANLDNDTLEIGGVFNPSEISEDSLDETQKAILDKTIQTFPQLKDLDIYVGIVGQPKFENGRLTLDKDSKLKVGKLTFSIDEIAPKFGLSPDKLDRYLEQELAKLNIQGIQIENDKMMIKMSQ